MSDFEFGPGGARRFATSSTRSITSDGVGTVRYPSPFFDIAHTYLPASFKTMLRWCRYYFLTNPLINAAVYKMAAYPVTDLVFDTDNEQLKKKWDGFFSNVINFKKFEVEVGLDFNCYGNCFISIFYPFQKYLICKACKHAERVDKQKYRFSEFKFYGTCKACRNYGEFEVKDHYIRSAKDIRLVRWNPEQISIHHNDATGETLYYYTIPAVLMNDIRMAKRHVIEKTPQVFIDALRLNKSLLFNKDNIYHMKRPTIAQKDKGWGLPMILPVLKDTFYLQILRKAQEAIAIEHIVPLRILFPQTAGPTSDVYSTVNLSSWKMKIEQEILRWRLDNNYIPILPLPVGQQTLGAEGRALMLAQEYRVWAEHIIAGMGVPVEFVFGGMQFSGSNVSLRILENQFLDSRSDHQALVQDFIMPNVGAFMDWQPVKTHFRRFKMADDLQRSAYHFQLNQAGKLSNKSLLEETDWDANIEQERIAEEEKKVLEGQRRQAVAQAGIQGEAQLVMQKYQLRAQKAMESAMSPAAGTGQPPPGKAQQPAQPQPTAGTTAPLPDGLQSPLNASQALDMDPGAVTLGMQDIAQRVSRMLDQMPEAERQPHLVQLRRANPQLYSIVSQDLQVRRGAHVSSAAMPAPPVKPARRGPEAAAA